jgi:hypothetical protein
MFKRSKKLKPVDPDKTALRLQKLPDRDLYQFVESSMMLAQSTLHQTTFDTTNSSVSLEYCQQNLKYALLGLDEMTRRSGVETY